MYFIVESGNKINVVLFTPKTTQSLPKIELIPEKVEKYNFTKSKKRPLQEQLQPVDIADWTILAEMPTYKQPKRVLQSDWWKAAAFLEMFVHWVFIILGAKKPQCVMEKNLPLLCTVRLLYLLRIL